ncbi:MAG: hypothetical protein ABJB12_07345 [Pseudomonadota bacterium]
MGILRESIFATIILTLSACGGAPAEPATPPPPPPPAAPEAPAASAAPAATEAPKPAETAAAPAPAEAPAAPAHEAWDPKATKDQQAAFMKKYVVPEMGPVFKAFDAKRYADFSCKTCHGPKYQNPKDFLPELTFKDGKLVKPANANAPKVAEWMGKEVVPHMAGAMGQKPFDMTTKTGFGCHDCHKVKM